MPALLEVYREVIPLPPDHVQRIGLVSLLTGVGALARSLQRPPSPYQEYLVGALRRALVDLHT